MKKRILSIILAISIILAGLCQPISAIATSIPTNEEKISNYLTAEDLSPREDEDSHYISALIELDYSIPSSIIENDTFSDEMTSDEVSQEIIRRRDTMRDFFKEKNESVVSDLDLGDFSYAVSWGAPYIEVFFEDFEEYSMKSEELFDAIDNNAEIQKATITGIEMSSTAAQNPSSYQYDYYYDSVLSDVGLNHATATGAGLNIGILESGIPDTPSKFNASQYTAIGNYATDHATSVGCLIADIASDANLYFMGVKKIENNALVTLSLTSCINVLIYTYYVDIINISMTYGSPNGQYNSYCKYIDSLISSSNCMIVIAAGNESTDTSNGSIVSPGCAMNAITVGSIDKNKKLSCFSSTQTLSTETYLFKPDMVAPGGRIIEFPNHHPGDRFNGTSYAAPIVTSIAILLMEDFPILRLEPAILKSILQASCEKVYAQSSVYDNLAGYGLVNYENAYNCFANVNYRPFNIDPNDANGSNVITLRVTLNPWETIDVAAFWLICQWNNTNKPTFTKATATIMDSNCQLLYETGIYYSNFSALSYTNEDYSPVTITITVTLLETKASGTPTEYGAFAYKIYE